MQILSPPFTQERLKNQSKYKTQASVRTFRNQKKMPALHLQLPNKILYVQWV